MITDIQPQSELVKRHVMSFNMFERIENFHLRFFAFPQYGSTLELFENTKIARTRNRITLKPIQKTGLVKNDYAVEIFGKYTEPVFLNYEGYVNGFAINFKPLGINYFFDKPYSELAPQSFQKVPAKGWIEFAEELFSLEKFEDRVKFAEQFLEKSVNDIAIPDIEKAVERIIADPAVSINELADVCEMNTRNLLRKFNRYVGCAPSVYKRIVRFRKAIDFSAWKEKDMDYMDICYDNNFFDTSHFRKEFLKLTHQNPSTFFKSISKIGNHQFPYKLM